MNKTREEAINLGKGKASKLIRKSKRGKGKGKPVLLKSLEGENQRKAILTGLIREEMVFQRKKEELRRLPCAGGWRLT